MRARVSASSPVAARVVISCVIALRVYGGGYPISTLPHWMQVVSWLLAPSYVFEAMRPLASGRAVSWPALAWGALLALAVIVLAGRVFTRVYRHAVRTGLVARYSAET